MIKVPPLVDVNVNSEQLLQERTEQIREDIEYVSVNMGLTGHITYIMQRSQGYG
jgi:hypothetical protein